MSTMPDIGLPVPPHRSPPSHRVYGPSALGGGLHRFWSLTFMLARTEFKLRFFGSILGYVWTLMRPLMLFGVMLFVFTDIIEINKGNPTEHYAEYLLESIILYTYFQEATAGAVPSMVARENLLRRVRFPRLVVPLSVALFCLFNLGMNLIVVFTFILASGITPQLSWLELIPMVMLLVVFSTGVGMLLSALYVRFRDVQPIWEVFLQLLYYGSPIMYTVQTAAKHHFLNIPFSRILVLNPLGAIITQARKALLQPSAPSAAAALGGTVRLLIPLGIVFGLFALGLWYFNREAPLISEKL
ncbi:MAG TPA: ABC transporter permease [Solirubrobacteraceae bacterium]|jgi:ABC-2 type transport system permease protein|nr:ABC transporter permease [Solirubrobacteraceae bacterium]